MCTERLVLCEGKQENPKKKDRGSFINIKRQFVLECNQTEKSWVTF
ncbi:MAG: hypothetical protein J1E07_10865 [Treponema sp.]|nr:hypothetical protein [Treponema sp.]